MVFGFKHKSKSDMLRISSTISLNICVFIGVRSPTEPACRVVFENEQDNGRDAQRKRSLVTSEPQHVTLIVFGIGMVNRTHLEADIGGLTMESELKRIHGSFTLKEKMKGEINELRHTR